MRDIEFRGRTLVTRRWVYGYYTVGRSSGTHSIESKDGTRVVDPATVGQYTGITDKNGRKIYEGDILEGLNGAARMVVFFAEITGYGYGFQWRPVKGGGLFESMTGFADEYAVIGNIHDNPELLDP